MVLTQLLGRTRRPLIASLRRLNLLSSNVKVDFHQKKEGIMIMRMGSSLAFASKVLPTDAHLSRLLQAEIKFEFDNDPPDQVQVHREDIPFSVNDKPGEQWMVLQRKYGKEDIKLEVTMIDLGKVPAEYYPEQAGEDYTSCTITLAVTISKGEGAPVMVIGCTVYPNEIVTDSVSVAEEESSEPQIHQSPDFREMSGDLQIAFRGYLEERGINSNLASILYDLMLNKRKVEYLRWLQTVKDFIENQDEI
ncbi:hypothetical protein SUGI_0054750 [Cryptomeria japonica]|uniref:uncharacterized protein At2g39795, mitochondrial n=1 Tax=Cryptomeria japonica TaxID=3369 RepID=UPI002408D5CE|nr:uncharacterized protein At2g39795, mitochondrial [Cryptomeria japonica]GLJ06981.1 hypothetical protein SUGI_0054750 [Cryptomeria japonica]